MDFHTIKHQRKVNESFDATPFRAGTTASNRTMSSVRTPYTVSRAVRLILINRQHELKLLEYRKCLITVISYVEDQLTDPTMQMRRQSWVKA